MKDNSQSTVLEPLPESVKEKHRRKLALMTAETSRTGLPDQRKGQSSKSEQVPDLDKPNGGNMSPAPDDLQSKSVVPASNNAASSATNGPLSETETDRVEIKKLHEEICERGRITLDKAIRVGELLSNRKSKCKHGKWIPWLIENVEFSESTACNYMRLFKNRGKIKSATLADLTDAYSLLADTTKTGGNKPNSKRHIPEPKRSHNSKPVRQPGPETKTLDKSHSISISEHATIAPLPVEIVEGDPVESKKQPIPLVKITEAPIEQRIDSLWKQICLGWLEDFPTAEEKRTLFSFLRDVSARAHDIIDEATTVAELYILAARGGGTEG
jgi:hypothetical protein